MNINATLFGQMITFAIFVWFTMKFVWPPIMNALAERKKTIADGLAAGERGHKELELSQQKATKQLREVKEQVAKIIKDANNQRDQIVVAAQQKAVEEGKRLIEAAKADIEKQVQQAKTQLQEQVALLALAGAEKILGQQIDASANTHLVDNIITEIKDDRR